MTKTGIIFNKPYMTGKELSYIREAHANGHLAGNGPFTKKCAEWLVGHTGCSKAVLTHSGTAALEMASLVLFEKDGLASCVSLFWCVTKAPRAGLCSSSWRAM